MPQNLVGGNIYSSEIHFCGTNVMIFNLWSRVIQIWEQPGNILNDEMRNLLENFKYNSSNKVFRHNACRLEENIT